ncbi:hypothetical protein [Peijinzhouia sedimentorum]
MQHRQFGDGRIVYMPSAYGYEYHYYHKDHLGNIRQVFRAGSTFKKNHSLSLRHKNSCPSGRRDSSDNFDVDK